MANGKSGAAGLSPAVSGTHGRRKSTPAALDMALRTAEGKAAIDELLKGETGTKKQMMFGQYFGATPAAGASGAAKLSAVPPMEVRNAPRPGKAAAVLAVKTHEYEFLQSGPDKGISTVLEDEDQMPGSISTSPLPSPSVMQPAENHLPKVTSPNQQTAVSFAPSQQLHQQSSLAPSSLPRTVEEEPQQPAGPRPKMLAISKNLPVAMTRKQWALSDYVIGRKMYTGYASTVYQVRIQVEAATGQPLPPVSPDGAQLQPRVHMSYV